ncbi:ubiquitin carboxyl-terminal hydrolase 7-like isoform X2 [Gigantopelta aegis]|nr:ubiquitin carboxyl-terminal hydrolase 7-like isoform X2 [Gigantopelta aegis]
MANLKRKMTVEIDQEYLSCTICLSIFKKPRILPCLHTFCGKCLQDYIDQQPDAYEKKGFSCPVCREFVSIPNPTGGWATQMKVDFRLDAMTDSMKQNKKKVEKNRAEATFQYTINRISTLTKSVASPAYIIRNLPWNIMVMPKLVKGKKSLGFYLQCNTESDSESWSCEARAELKILPQCYGRTAFIRRTVHTYSSQEYDWGFSNFISWDDLLNPAKGYVKDDNVHLEVHVEAEEPQM